MQIYTLNQALTGSLLVSMPSLRDPALRKGVILVCAHSATGAIGILVNRPAKSMSLENLGLPHLANRRYAKPRLPVRSGGPADTGHILVLHGNDYEAGDQTVAVTPDIRMTSDRAVLLEMSRGQGPEQVIITSGYCAWRAGELEDEVRRGVWLTTEASNSFLFRTAAKDRWAAAVTAMGAAPAALSGQAGHC